MNRFSRARSYISLVLFKKSSYVTSHIPWNQCFYMPSKTSLKPASVSVLGLSSVHCYSSRSKTAKSKMSKALFLFRIRIKRKTPFSLFERVTLLELIRIWLIVNLKLDVRWIHLNLNTISCKI